MRRLNAAGARTPEPLGPSGTDTRIRAVAASVKRLDVMIPVPDMRATVDWYRSIGFELEENMRWTRTRRGRGCPSAAAT